jgi:hypothetical protein
VPSAMLRSGEHRFGPCDVIVPACAECNGILGAQVFDSMAERRAFVQGRLRVKHAKLLSMPLWTDWELEELEGSLRRHVKAALAARHRLILRLLHEPDSY